MQVRIFYRNHMQDYNLEDQINEFLDEIEPEDVVSIQYQSDSEGESALLTYKVH